MVAGSLGLMVQSLRAVGGYEALMDQYSLAEPDPQVQMPRIRTIRKSEGMGKKLTVMLINFLNSKVNKSLKATHPCF